MLKHLPRRKTVGSSHRGGRYNRKRQRAYKAFIRSPLWREIREAKLQSVKGVCENCPADDLHGASEVHHTNYARFGGDELTTDLLALCKDCHRRTHKTARRLRGMWLSLRVGADHAMTQFGLDIREQLIASYDH